MEGMKSFDFDEMELLEQQAKANVEPIAEAEEDEYAPTPMADLNKGILGSINHRKMFNDLLLEVHDVESSLNTIQESFTEALLKRGIPVNPQDMYRHLDLTVTRLMKVYSLKRMCMSLGLHIEYDKILDHELGLIYGPGANRRSQNYSGRVVGEANNGGKQ